MRKLALRRIERLKMEIQSINEEIVYLKDVKETTMRYVDMYEREAIVWNPSGVIHQTDSAIAYCYKCRNKLTTKLKKMSRKHHIDVLP